MDKLDELLSTPTIKVNDPHLNPHELKTQLMLHKEAIVFAKEIILQKLFNKDEAAKIVQKIDKIKDGLT